LLLVDNLKLLNFNFFWSAYCAFRAFLYLNQNPEDELRREAPQLIFWVYGYSSP